MNSVLSTLTWGTWDDAEWTLANSTTEAHVPEVDNRSTLPKKQRSFDKLRQKGLQAPKNSKLWFEELLTYVEDTSFDRNKATYFCNPLQCLHMSQVSLVKRVTDIPWADLPDGIHPRDGKLPAQRARNKRQQVDNLAVFLQRILSAHLFYSTRKSSPAIGMKNRFKLKAVAVQKKTDLWWCVDFAAKERIAAAHLTNVKIFCGFINDYFKPFDVGIALHACGEATDMLMQKCLAERAAYVLAPCCVGKIKSSKLVYPRSATLAAKLSRTEYEVLAKAADFGHSSKAAVAQTDINRRRRRCKTLLESDRNMCAEEAQYDTFMFIMHPPTATPKIDVLVGIPRNLSAGQNITEYESRHFQLECEEMLLTNALVRKAMLGA